MPAVNLHRFQARAGLLSVVGLLYASACGGPYGTEDYIVQTGPGLMILLLLLAPWLWGVPMAFATAELSSARPIEGGYYVWIRDILGPFWGFQAGIWSLISSFLDNALYPVLFAKGLMYWFPGALASEERRWLAAVAFIALLTWFNLRGIRIVGTAAVALNLFLIAPLVWIVAAGFARAQHNPFLPFTAPGVDPWSGLGAGLALTIWFYSGYTEVSTAAEEIENPARNIPRALLIVTPLVILSYAAPLVAGLASVGNWSTWQSGEFARIGEALGGPILGHWALLGSIASFTVIFMSYLLWWSRLGWALAADRSLPSWLARLHPRYGTPHRVLLVYAVGYALLARLDFEDLLMLDVWVFGAYDLLLLAAVIRGRTVLAERPAGFRIPGGTAGVWINALVPAAAWIVVLWATERENVPGGVAVLLLPTLLYGARHLLRRASPRRPPGPSLPPSAAP
jgi:amino acid transporter